MEKRSLIIFAGGGTGGHIYPGIAVIARLRERRPDLSFLWICSSSLDKKILSQEHISFHSIASGKLRRYFSWKNFLTPFMVLFGAFQSFLWLLFLHPVLVFSKGGFVSTPVVIAARALRIPVVTHESDLSLGLASKINSRFASALLLSYSETQVPKRGHLSVVVTGNPIRPELLLGTPELARDAFPELEKRGKPLLLVLGGSLGASQLNLLVFQIASELTRSFTIIHQVGRGRESSAPVLEGYLTVPYINQALLQSLYSVAGLAISRAGASLLWELSAKQIPAVLVPYSNGSRGDQKESAHFFEKKGIFKVLPLQGSSSEEAEKLLAAAQGVFAKREAYKKAACDFDAAGGAQRVCDFLLTLPALRKEKA